MKIVIYGNGAMARILFSYARHSMDICGFTVDDICIKEKVNTFCGQPLVPFNAVENTFDPKEYKIIIAIGFIDMNELRDKKYLEAKEKGYSFANYIHPSVFMHDDVFIGKNCIMLDHVSIHPGCRIGNSTFISSNVNIGHDCIIGPSNWINSGVMIAGGCEIGQGCFFGVNSSVGQGVQVGARNFIAANTLVNKNTKDNEVYISEPGQLFRLNSKSFLKFSRVLEKT
jgi:sugar O-acyltransferase (sialic acid O-acetyltransferase NeuD family)